MVNSSGSSSGILGLPIEWCQVWTSTGTLAFNLYILILAYPSKRCNTNVLKKAYLSSLGRRELNLSTEWHSIKGTLLSSKLASYKGLLWFSGRPTTVSKARMTQARAKRPEVFSLPPQIRTRDCGFAATTTTAIVQSSNCHHRVIAPATKPNSWVMFNISKPIRFKPVFSAIHLKSGVSIRVDLAVWELLFLSHMKKSFFSWLHKNNWKFNWLVIR